MYFCIFSAVLLVVLQPVCCSGLNSLSNNSGHSGILPSHAVSRNASARQLAVNTCEVSYGERSFVPPKYQKRYTFLYTFPGSGNTWARLLLEFATGYYTGSVYNDRTLIKALPGQLKCGSMVSVIKAHPHTHTIAQLMSNKFQSDANKCHKTPADRVKLQRAILLIRDPFDSIWSEYQRRVTHSHTGGIEKKEFDWDRWLINSDSLAHSYKHMWQHQYDMLAKKLPASDIMYVRYEDLRDPEKRTEVVADMMLFLNYTSEHTLKNGITDLYNPQNTGREELLKRAACAFVLAENTLAHRPSMSSTMQKSSAYTEKVACGMWAIFGEYATKHGYRPWNNVKCGKGSKTGQKAVVRDSLVPISINISSSSTRNLMDCKQLYGKRTYVPLAHQKHSAFLYTFPGSGNTWTRLILDYATGYFTGSVYGDKSLTAVLPGEKSCGALVSVIKAHPTTHNATFLMDKFRCQRSPTTTNSRLQRAILLIRDPFDSIWSEYQRKLTQSHTGGLDVKGFDWARWHANAGALAHSYRRMWDEYEAIMQRFPSDKAVHFTRYEDLKNADTRINAVGDMVRFLNITSQVVINGTRTIVDPSTMPPAYLDQRISCSFLLAENGAAHRPSKTGVMQKSDVYTKEIACGMWAVFGEYASKHGYHPWDNLDCTDIAALEDTPVGPAGMFPWKKKSSLHG